MPLDVEVGVKQVQGTNSDGSISATLTGSNVVERSLFNALAITDTVSHESLIIDISAMSGKKYLHINNTLDQTVTFTMRYYTSGQLAGISRAITKTIAANTSGSIIDTDEPLLGVPLQQIKLYAICAVAPTSGSLSVWIEGGKI